MNEKLAKEIQKEQDHGRQKYGNWPGDFIHDNLLPEHVWHVIIADHNERAKNATPLERRQYLIKVAGLAVSAVEAFDRNQKSRNSQV